MKQKIIMAAGRGGLENHFISDILKHHGEESAYPNFHILTFIIVFFYKAYKVQKGTVEAVFRLLSKELYFPEWTTELQDSPKFVMHLLALGIVASKYTGNRFSFLKKNSRMPDFYIYAVFLISCFHRKDLGGDESMEIEKGMLEFLFSSAAAERLELERLYFFTKQRPCSSPCTGVSPFVRAYGVLYRSTLRFFGTSTVFSCKE